MFDVADEQGRLLPFNQVSIGGNQLYELIMGDDAPITSLPELPDFGYPMVFNQDELYTNDPCYGPDAVVEPTSEPVKGCPYLFPAAIFEDLTASIAVGERLVVANAHVGVQ